MEPIEIGIAVSIGLLVFVILGMRVAFAAAIAGVVGLIWIFWAKKGYTGDSFLMGINCCLENCRSSPAFKSIFASIVSYSNVHSYWIFGLLCRINKSIICCC